MVKCEVCGTENDDNATICRGCQGALLAQAIGGEIPPSVQGFDMSDPSIRRPRGLVLSWIGAGLMIGGAITYLFGMATRTSDYVGNIDAARLAQQVMLEGMGMFAFETGLACALTGTIVRAIWFVQGEEKKVP